MGYQSPQRTLDRSSHLRWGKEKALYFSSQVSPIHHVSKRPLLSALVNFLEPSAHTVGYSIARMGTAGA